MQWVDTYKVSKLYKMTYKNISISFLMLAAISFSACEKTSRTSNNIQVVTKQKTYVPKFNIEEAEFKDKILQIIPAESVNLAASVTQVNDEEEQYSFTINIYNPEEFSNPLTFNDQVEEVKEQVIESVTNLDRYEKIYVNVEEKTSENGLERTRTQKREFSL